MAPNTAALDALKKSVGDSHVITDPDLTVAYINDWTGRFHGKTPAVVRPGSTEEVAAVLHICSAERIAVVPQGGNTGLVGGSVPLTGEIVLSLTRLTDISDFDTATGQLTAGAGATLAQVQSFAVEKGLRFAIDFSARDSATIGGMVATNAGGFNFLRYGGMRQQLVGTEAVLASGKIISDLSGVTKNNTGYDLPSLLCGSEGTLAIITAARLRLVPQPAERVTALCGMASLQDAVSAVSVLRSKSSNLESLEVFLSHGAELASKYGARVPFIAPVYLLAEVAGEGDVTTELSSAVEETRCSEVAVATDSSARADLWSAREKYSEAIANKASETNAVTYKYDVSVPLRSLSQFCDELIPMIVSLDKDSDTYIFGHIAEGNLHINILSRAGEVFDRPALELVARFGGSISAEHGVGAAKKEMLHLSRSAEEIATMRAIKNALDPEGILNPNALLP